MAMEIEHKHSFNDGDARERLKALGEYFENKHGLAVKWTSDDRASITGKYLVVSIDGVVELRPGLVHFSGKDPGMLWRGKAKDYLKGKLVKFFDASTPVASLPRS